MRSKVVPLALVVLAAALAAAPTEAAHYYVSPSGSANWPDCANIATPCSPATAFANAVAGDTVYFRGGTYMPGPSSGSAPANFPYQPAHSGSADNPITFKGYPMETAIVAAYPTIGPPGNYNRQDICFGAVSKSYIVFDGFTLVGRDSGHGTQVGQAYLWGTDHCEFKNLIIDGGTFVQGSVSGEPGNDNCDGMRIDESTNSLVQNCLFRNIRHVSNYHNTSALKFYGTWGVGSSGGTVENCTFHDIATSIYVKRAMHDLVIRNNFFHNVNEGVLLTTNMSYAQSDRGHVYNNLMINATGVGFNANNDGEVYHGNDWELYNNTLYNTGIGFYLAAGDSGHGWKVYNNISSNQAEDLTTMVNTRLSEVDHNEWGTGALKIWLRRYQSNQTTYTSLAAWQASTELDGARHPGAGDLASDPGFSNESGTLRLKTDFVLAAMSPCRGRGRNGVDMGALNIAGIGYFEGGVPAAPTGLKIIKVP